MGDYDIVASGEAVQGNYDVVFEPATLTISAADTLVVTGTGIEVTYDGESHGVPAVASVAEGTTIQYSIDGGETWQTGYPTLTDAGAIEVQVRATNPNYQTATATYTITIAQKAATVRALDANKVYGATDPALQASVTGVLGADTLTYELARDAGQDVGEYAITATGEASQGNYAVTFEPAVFTITPAAVTVTAHNAAKVYGEDDPAFQATVSGLVAGDAEDVINYEFARAQGEGVGEYAITVSGAATQGNYRVSYVPAALTITRANTLVLAVTDTQATYTSEPIAAAVAVPSVAEGTTVEYSTDGGETWQAEVPSFTDDRRGHL